MRLLLIFRPFDLLKLNSRHIVRFIKPLTPIIALTATSFWPHEQNNPPKCFAYGYDPRTQLKKRLDK